MLPPLQSLQKNMKNITLHAPRVLTSEEKTLYKDYPKIFLAGSIEMGVAEPWQEEFTNRYSHLPIVFLNPRRPDWDSTWTDTSDAFNEQVNWELDHLDAADMIILYFDPATKSPISLLELGLFADHDKTVVCCPDGFWRKGNVRIVCERYGVPLAHSKEELLEKLDAALHGILD